jgi:hypothetical protein
LTIFQTAIIARTTELMIVIVLMLTSPAATTKADVAIIANPATIVMAKPFTAAPSQVSPSLI